MPLAVQSKPKAARPKEAPSRSSSHAAARPAKDRSEALASLAAGGGARRAAEIQAKIAFGGPRDPFEREADQVADRVAMNASVPQISSIPSGGLGSSFQKMESGGAEEAVQSKRSAAAFQSRPTRAGIAAAAIGEKGPGQPIEPRTRATLEARMGLDLSPVRVHKDARANRAASGLGARAFAHGKDVWLARGESDADLRLMAHETAHVAQQRAVSRPQDPGWMPVQAMEDPAVQTAETEAAEDPAAELAASEQAAVEAIDPGPAERADQAAQQQIEAAIALGDEATAEGEAPTAEAVPVPEEAPAEPAAKKPEPAREKKEKAPAPKKKKGRVSVLAYLKAISDPAAQLVKRASETQAKAAQTHDNAADKRAQADLSVEPPANEGPALGAAAQVETVDEKPAPELDPEARKQSFRTDLDRAAPGSIEAMNAFKSRGKGQIVGSKVLGNISKDVGAVMESYGEMRTEPAPKPDPAIPQPLPEAELMPETPAIEIGGELVPPLEQEHTDFSDFGKQSDDLLKKEEFSEENLEMVDEGELFEAKMERKGLKQKVKQEPGKIQDFAAQESQKTQLDLKAEEQSGKAEILDKRAKGLDASKGEQQKAKTTLEKKREGVAKKINGIYEAAKKSVTLKLNGLEKTSLDAFDLGQANASREFETEVNTDISAWKRRRYSGFFAGAKWLKDKLFGIDHFPEIQRAFEHARSSFVTKIDALIVGIQAENARVIQECKQELADARKTIKEFVDGLGPELKTAGDDALKVISTKLDEMDGFIDQKKQELDKKLDQKREAAIKAIDEKIEKMKEEMSGIVGKLANLLLAAALKFFKWALKKVGADSGQLMAILDKGKSVLKAIIGDPIGFLGNVISAIKQGVFGFQKNILVHLANGMINWLTGAMGGVGITLPQTFDLKGILSIILQVVGLTWQNLRQKLVVRLGEPIVGGMEKTVEIVQRVIVEGPMALWEMIKDKAEEIKQQVMDGIRDWIVVEVVKQAIFKLVSMLNPVGAIVQAILMIYNTVMFFVENWQRIVEFVGSVFNSIGEIAFGRIGAAAKKIEEALAMTIPIIINFLLRFAGLGNIGKSLRGIIMKASAPVDRVMNKAADIIAKKANVIIKKAGAAVEKGKDAVLGWLGLRKKIQIGGEDHTLYMEKKGAETADLMMRSTPMPIEAWIKQELAKPGDAARKKKLQQVAGWAARIKNLKDTKSMGQAVGEQITRLFANIAKALADLGDENTLPPTVYTTTPQTQSYTGPNPKDNFTSTDGEIMVASPLSLNPGGNNGSEPAEESELYKHVKPRKNTFVEGHLLNHNLFGIGKARNMAPLPRTTNSQMSKGFEEPLKRRVLQDRSVVHYEVKMLYGSRPPRASLAHEHRLPTGVSLSAHEMELKAGATDRTDPKNWVPNASKKIFIDSLTVDLGKIPDTNPHAGEMELKRVNIRGKQWVIPGMSEADSRVILERQLMDLKGIGPKRVELLISKNWTSYAQIKAELKDSAGKSLFTDKQIESLRDDNIPVIRMTGPTVYAPK